MADKKKKVQAKHNHKTIKSFGNLQNGSQSSSINLTFSFLSSFAKKKKKKVTFTRVIFLYSTLNYSNGTPGDLFRIQEEEHISPHPPTHIPEYVKFEWLSLIMKIPKASQSKYNTRKLEYGESNTPLKASKRQTMQESLTIITRWKRTEMMYCLKLTFS